MGNDNNAKGKTGSATYWGGKRPWLMAPAVVLLAQLFCAPALADNLGGIIFLLIWPIGFIAIIVSIVLGTIAATKLKKPAENHKSFAVHQQDLK